jgi:hypothetical protein
LGSDAISTGVSGSWPKALEQARHKLSGNLWPMNDNR